MTRNTAVLSGALLLAGGMAVGAMAPTASRAAAPAITPGGVQDDERVTAISPPSDPLPAEDRSAGVTKFSFLAYGDTRGPHDGTTIQFEHSLVVESMLASIKKQ